MGSRQETQTWSRIGPLFHSSTTPDHKPKRTEFLVTCRRMGGSLYLVLPAQVRRDMGLYEGAPVSIVLVEKTAKLKRLETITASQLDILRARFPHSKQPWKKKIKALGRHDQSQQYDLR